MKINKIIKKYYWMNIESSDGENTWSIDGISANIIEASWQALRDSLNYKLLQTRDKVLTT